MAISDFKNISKDDILAALGLETKQTMGDHIVSGLLMMGVGLAVGIGIGMLIAPKSGGELRDDLGRRYRKTMDMAQEAMSKDQPTSHGTSSSAGLGSAGSGSMGSGSSTRNPV
jgi:hypothetical protein